MNAIECLIFITLIHIAFTDYKKHVITNWSNFILLVLGLINKFIKYQLMTTLMAVLRAVMLLLLGMTIGYVYYQKQGVDIAGGGDYKLIATLGCVFELEELFLCFVFQFIFEFIYRYIICPKKKHVALPLGASLGIISTIILVGGI